MLALVRYAEIGTKGKNRPAFESKLIENIKAMAGQKVKVVKTQGRLLVYSEKGSFDFLKKVFGIASFSPALECSSNPAEAAALAQNWLWPGCKFKVSCQRVDKRIQKTSIEFASEVGKLLVGAVDLKKPDIEICIELINGKAFVFKEKIPGPGGLPLGSSGKLLALLDDKAGLLAALLAMRRGCPIFPIAEKHIDISILQKFSPDKLDLKLIRNEADIADISKQLGVRAIVAGKAIKTSLPVLLPCAFMSEKQIEEQLERYAKL